jgi:hypothetical protein
VSVVTFFPIGTLVRTTLGEVGLVVSTHDDDALHPLIVLLDMDRPDVPAGPVVDLRERNGKEGFVRDVAESVASAGHNFDVPALLRAAEGLRSA